MLKDQQAYRFGTRVIVLLLSLFLSGCRSDKSQFLKAIEKNDWGKAQTILKLHPELINIYLEHGHTLLYAAVYYDNKEMAMFLIKNKINVNAGNKEGNDAPLHLAASMGRYEMASLLIENGADVNCHDDTLHTPLHIACMSSQNEIVKLLLDQGAEIDAKTQDQKTPLYYISCSNTTKMEEDLEIIRILLDKGADPNFKCGTDHTIIVSALANRQFKKAKLMCEYGAVLELPTEEGYELLKGEELKQYIEECQMLIENIPEQELDSQARN